MGILQLLFNRNFIIIGIIFVVVVVIGYVAVSAGSNGGSTQNPTGTCTVTINGCVGLSSVTITNQNTGKTIIRAAAELPYTFNLNKGDTIRLNVTTLSPYAWNAWEIDKSPWFAQDNPLVIKVTANTVFDANCLLTGE
jgi:hypothetical protein